MLTALRAAWARADFAPLRGVVGRAGDALRPAPDTAPPGESAGTRVWINPGSGALFRGLTPIAAGPDGGGRGGRAAPPSDWIVQAFPARARVTRAIPLWYGARPDLLALLGEALPRHLAREAAGIPEDAVSVISLGLGRLDCVQDALAAGVFAPRPLRVHAWDKLIGADAVHPCPVPGAAEMRGVASHLRACFGIAPDAPRSGPALALGRPDAPGMAEAVTRGARGLDPSAASLFEIVAAAAAAPEAFAGGESEALCVRLLAPEIPVAITAEAESDPLSRTRLAAVENQLENRDASVTEARTAPEGGL
ncbi:hypothetical protein SAMN05444336_1101 [Albimonas donghaensis]|uniref:Uncharacterized protein n=1 Tax=Albimonas donghaensis TaxID=356660 RepID=A0A1H3EHE1_9RHOB|nr:hypothetical protein [Albimonas donghaensis]SDX77349.1 hypothetical protein SAMN05444336_1101 [Albimonas donghaensis]